MKLSAFTADNAQDAVRLVQENLGPEAVIMSVRKLPASGFARLLHRPGQIEVTAGVPEKPRHAVPPGVEAYVPFGEDDRRVRCRLPRRRARPIAGAALPGWNPWACCRNSPTGWN